MAALCAPSGSFKPAEPGRRVRAVKVLLVGSGGREHALAWKLAQSPRLTELHAAPGNPGIARHGHCHPVRAEDAESLVDLARTIRADLAVVGPEAPLVGGIGDALRKSGIGVFGPSAAAARIEGSKRFAKDVMRAAGVATAATLAVARPPCVIKVDGLAAGKGVYVCRTQDELDAALRAASAYEGQLVVEELLEGPEVSVFAITDGQRTLALPPARDFKRAYDDDAGPNTGGMGAYCPAGLVDVDTVVESVHRPVLDELARRGTPFVGVLFAGLMLTAEGPRVLEFNCRFGDPEAQTILPLLDGDVLSLLAGAAAGDLGASAAVVRSGAAVTIVVAGAEYPDRNDIGSAIAGIDAAEAAGALVFHAGTAQRGERVVTNGGRILDVTATADTVEAARSRAYDAVRMISFAGARYRTDIAREAARVG
jgi:phosphoribosylamine---glycine ligase